MERLENSVFLALIAQLIDSEGTVQLEFVEELGRHPGRIVQLCVQVKVKDAALGRRLNQPVRSGPGDKHQRNWFERGNTKGWVPGSDVRLICCKQIY